MITRIWHGRTKSDKTERYLEFLREEGTREYLQTEGNRSVKVWVQRDKEITHFWTVTEWSDIEAIKKFAGEDYSKARYYPQDEGMLLEFEENAQQYDCYDASNQRLKEYLRQFRQLYDGGSWQGESISAKLKNLTDAEAFQQPSTGVRSVAEIVWHCIYWRTVFLKRMEGDQLYRDQTVEKLNFLPLVELQKKGWTNLLTELQQTQSTIYEILGAGRDSFLEEEYQEGRTFDYLVEGLIHHDIYHLGQIGLVISLVHIRHKAEN